jgi:hypothetical protein
MNLLATDGQTTGLDVPSGATAPALDGQDVTACAGVDFGAVYDLRSVIIRGMAVGSACGTACADPYCGTGHAILVYTGNAPAVYSYLATITPGDTLQDYPVTLPAAARYIVVCRSGAGYARDDVAIDSITRGPCP